MFRSHNFSVRVFCFLFAFLRYDSPQHIMEEFFTLRMEFYHRRKASLMNKMQSEWSKLDNKVGLRALCSVGSDAGLFFFFVHSLIFLYEQLKISLFFITASVI